MSNLQEQYEQLTKKYTLPSFGDIDTEFEISSLEQDEPFLMRSIRRKITGRIDTLLKITEELLHPEGRIMAMMESSVFADKDLSEQLQSIFKQLASLFREGQYVGLLQDDTQQAAYITKSTEQITDIRKKLATIIQKVHQIWQQDAQYEHQQGYFG